jgi:hypothetical protein
MSFGPTVNCLSFFLSSQIQGFGLQLVGSKFAELFNWLQLISSELASFVQQKNKRACFIFCRYALGLKNTFYLMDCYLCMWFLRAVLVCIFDLGC